MRQKVVTYLLVKAILCYYKTPDLFSYMFTQNSKHISVTGNVASYEEYRRWHQTNPDSNYDFTTE